MPCQLVFEGVQLVHDEVGAAAVSALVATVISGCVHIHVELLEGGECAVVHSAIEDVVVVLQVVFQLVLI